MNTEQIQDWLLENAADISRFTDYEIEFNTEDSLRQILELYWFRDPMPFAKCPNCGAEFHLRVTTNLEEWCARNAPGIPRNQPAPLLCLPCWKKARSGTLRVEDLAVSAEVLANLQRMVADEPTAGS